MKLKNLSLLVAASLVLFSCSSSSKNESAPSGGPAADASRTGESFPYAQYWNCVVKARGKTFYGRAGNAIEARAQAQNECSAKFKKTECNPVLCEMKDADGK